METEVISLLSDEEEREYGLKRAGELLRNGKLVAFPTETVYGLGANGLDGAAVREIYHVKGRPTDNPSILHVGRPEDAFPLWREVPDGVLKLMNTFWPGPLTIICKHSDLVPKEVTGGLDTVAVRMPSDENARKMLLCAGVPVAAPSANLSGKPSPTTCRHVVEDLEGRVPLILDGGPCRYGVESTVISMVAEPKILRPGIISPEMIAAVIGNSSISESILRPLGEGEVAASPGMKYKHYAPKAEVIVISGDPEAAGKEICRQYDLLSRDGKKCAIAATEQTKSFYRGKNYAILGDRDKPETMCSSLFRVLRDLDCEADVILAEGIPAKEVGLAFMNRLLRAAGFHVINV